MFAERHRGCGCGCGARAVAAVAKGGAASVATAVASIAGDATRLVPATRGSPAAAKASRAEIGSLADRDAAAAAAIPWGAMSPHQRRS